MAKESTSSLEEVIRQARSMLALNPMMAPQMEQFWKAQDGMLQEAESFSRGWFARRHDEAETALDALQKMNGAGADPSVAVQALADWQRKSLGRAVEDMQQWVEFWSRCTSRCVNAEMEATDESLDEIGKRTKSVAASKHATPV